MKEHLSPLVKRKDCYLRDLIQTRRRYQFFAVAITRAIKLQITKAMMVNPAGLSAWLGLQKINYHLESFMVMELVKVMVRQKRFLRRVIQQLEHLLHHLDCLQIRKVMVVYFMVK